MLLFNNINSVKMEIARLQTGQKYENLQKIISTVKEMLPTVPNESFRHIIKFRMECLERYHGYYASSSKKIERAKFALEIERNITLWNKMVSKYRHNTWANQIPTLNTKPRKYHGHVKEKIDKGFDSIESDFTPDTKTLSVCSHKRGTHNYPCCMLTLENLKGLVQCAFKDPSQWSITEHHFQKIDGKIAKSILGLRCQMKKTNHCPSDHHGKCGSIIPFKKIMSFFPLEIKKEYSYNKIMELYMMIITNQHPEKVKYCKKPTCKFANTGFCNAQILTNLSDLIYCDTCMTQHHVHAHKIECPDATCNTSYCEVCHMSPYHDTSVCQGPKPDGLTEEDYKILLATTRPCPSCKKRVEKRDGCDHMQCTCNTHWCWRCLQKLDERNPYKHNCLSSETIAGRRDHAYNEFGNDLEHGMIHQMDVDSDDDL